MSNIQLLPSVPNPGYYNPCSGALSMTLPQETMNLITEPSFEVYASTNWPAQTNWRIALHTGATVNPITSYIVTGTESYAGASSLYSRTISGNHVVSVAYASISVTSGYYAWSFYIRGDAQSNGRSYVSTIRNSSTNAILASKQFALVENQWNRIELVWYSTSSISVTVGIEKNAVSGSFIGGDCWIDACQFEKLQVQNITGSTDGLRATTYFDGSTLGFYGSNAPVPEYAWRGNPHRSISIRSSQTNHGGRVINLQDQCALEIISINEAGMNQPTNHDGIFNTADGGQLVDIVNSKRTITMIGRVSGTDKNDFAQKMAQLTAYFSRDVTSMRTPRRFIFQHKDGRENIGIELTFFAAFESGLNATLSDAYVANVEISLTMYDPYFYGHDESMDLSKELYGFNVGATNRSFVAFYSPNLSEMVDSSTYDTTWQLIGANNDISFNGRINAIDIDKNGIVWIGGSFTTELSSGATYNRIVKYNPATKVLIPVLTGATNGVNGEVFDIKVDTYDNKVWVAGSFTSAGGVANSGYIAYYNQATSAFVASPGQPNNTVYSIGMSKYSSQIVIGGAFTLIAGVAFNRLARLSASFTWESAGTANGVNNIVRKVFWPTINDQSTSNQIYYIGGDFTQTASGTTADKIAILQGTLLTNIGFGLTGAGVGQVFDIVDDADGNIIFRFANPATTQITNYTTGQVTSNYNTTNGTGENSLCYYNGFQLNFWPVNSAVYLQNTTTLGVAYNTLAQFRGGIVSAEWGNYWPGTATSATTFARFNDRGFGDFNVFMAVKVSPDQSMYVGLNGTLSSISGLIPISCIQSGFNSSTVASIPVIQAITNTSLSPQSVINWQNNRVVDLLSATNAVLGSRQLIVGSNDYLQFDFRSLDFSTKILGNVLRYIQPNSNITTFNVLPGNVHISLYDNNQLRSSNPTTSTQSFWNMYWKQTFQSIFDGVNKS